jgi:uncharacterized protein YndB with AHSA1/START domain
MAFRFDRTFVFDHEPDAVWDVLSRPQDFPRWWSWLRRIDFDDELREGTTARCLIRAPIPWPLHLNVHVDRVAPGRRIDVHASGDLSGPASLELDPHPRGTQAHMTWALEPRVRMLSGFMTGPVLRWGQDWVVGTGLRQFERRAFG